PGGPAGPPGRRPRRLGPDHAGRRGLRRGAVGGRGACRFRRRRDARDLVDIRKCRGGIHRRGGRRRGGEGGGYPEGGRGGTGGRTFAVCAMNWRARGQVGRGLPRCGPITSCPPPTCCTSRSGGTPLPLLYSIGKVTVGPALMLGWRPHVEGRENIPKT